MNSSKDSGQRIFAAFTHFLHFVGAAVVALVVALIPKFVVMYHDLLGSEPLPSLTLLVLRLHPLWIAMAVIFAFAGLYLLWHWRLRPAPDGFSLVFFSLAGMQVALLLIGLFQPLAGTIIRQKPTDAVTEFVR